MTCSKGVIFRLVATEKPADTAVLFDCRKHFFSTGENFMRVCLMADIPNQPIARCVEGVMKRNRKLYCSQRCARMTTNTGHCFQDVLAYFIGNGLQLIKPEPPQISGRVY